MHDVRLAAEGKSGRLTVGFAGAGINGALGDALGRLRAELPGVELSLVELFDDAEIAAARRPAPVSVLGEVPLVLWPRDAVPQALDEITALCHHAGIVPEVAARARTVQTIFALVAAGFGPAVMTDSYRVLRREGVTTRRLEGTATTLHLAWPAGDLGPLLARFMNVVNAVGTAKRQRA